MKEWQKWTNRHYKHTKKNYEGDCSNVWYRIKDLIYYVYKNNLTTNNKKPTSKFTKGNVFALYDGEDIVCMGTLPEIVEQTDYKMFTLKWYASPSAIKKNRHKRVVLLEGW